MNQPPANNNHRPVTPRSGQSGVGLIEVLIAVLVLSIGILGLAALQTRALASNGSSMGQSMATLASYSILDAMRADQTNAIQNAAYNGTVTANNCPATGGTLVKYQLNLWCTQLGQYLGAAATTTGTINCATTDICTITIQYDDSRSAAATPGNAVTQTLVTTAEL